MASCAREGGCPSDYVALAISILAMIVLCIRAAFPFIVYKVPRTKASGYWLLMVQTLASFNLLLSVVMSYNYLNFKRSNTWLSCYTWAVWFEGPLGFGLLMCCRIVQAFQLYHLFVKRHLPPVRSYVLLPLILLPWVGVAAFIQINKPLNHLCHMRIRWAIPISCFHTLYVAALVGIARAIQHIDFRFHEFKDLLLGILVSTFSIGIWVAAYITNEVYEDTRWLQVTSRFLLLLATSLLVLGFFSISTSHPLLAQMSLRRREPEEFESMGRALGIPDSGLLLPTENIQDINLNEPFDKLLLKKRFRKSFMAFADSCLAGESAHFYEEVLELGKIRVDDPVRRIYMARHIIEKYIVSGSEMEVNISHRTRQEILGTLDLAHPDLFKPAVNELVQLMKMNLAKDYWSSTFFMKFKEETETESYSSELMERVVGWDFSPRLSSVHGVDDPFRQEHSFKVLDHRNDIHDPNPSS